MHIPEYGNAPFGAALRDFDRTQVAIFRITRQIAVTGDQSKLAAFTLLPIMHTIAFGEIATVIADDQKIQPSSKARTLARLSLEPELARVKHFNSILPGNSFSQPTQSVEELSDELSQALDEGENPTEGLVSSFTGNLQVDVDKFMEIVFPDGIDLSD